MWTHIGQKDTKIKKIQRINLHKRCGYIFGNLIVQMRLYMWLWCCDDVVWIIWNVSPLWIKKVQLQYDISSHIIKIFLGDYLHVCEELIVFPFYSIQKIILIVQSWTLIYSVFNYYNMILNINGRACCSRQMISYVLTSQKHLYRLHICHNIFIYTINFPPYN